MRQVDDGVGAPARRGAEEKVVRLVLPGGPESIARARELLDGWSLTLGPSVTQSGRLLLSELVTNCVREHAAHETTVSVEVTLTAERLRIEVEGEPADLVPRQAPDEDPARGWGLLMVDELSDRWGVRFAGRLCVWAELDRS